MRITKNPLGIAAAGAIAASGILHFVIALDLLALIAGPAGFFIFIGITQLGLALASFATGRKVWMLGGSAWSVFLIAFFVMTLYPNPVTGGAIPAQPIDIVIQALQAAYIGLVIAVLVQKTKMKRLGEKEKSELV